MHKNNTKITTRIWCTSTIIICLILLDQITKLISIRLLQNKSIDIGPISFILKRNTGFAFSFLQDYSALTLCLPLILIIYLIYILIQEIYANNYQMFLISIILAGAISNYFDRLFKGYVLDMIQLNFINWPIFNLADIFICSGVFLVIYNEINQRN